MKEETKQEIYAHVGEHPLAWIGLILLADYTLAFYSLADPLAAWLYVRPLAAVGLPLGVVLQLVPAIMDAWKKAFPKEPVSNLEAT